MPRTDVVFYADTDGSSPPVQWIAELPEKVQDKLWVRIVRLEEMGHALRRPECDLLRDRIYELRVRHQQVNYRLLYFFFANVAAVIAHGCTKVADVPEIEIDRAVRRRQAFFSDPEGRTYGAPDE